MEANVFMVVSAAFLGTACSLSAAAWLGFGRLSKMIEPMVSLSTGVLLSTALLHLLPEAFDSPGDHHIKFAWLLGGLLLFFVLEKLSLFRHSHHHEHDGHDHSHGFDAEHAGRGGILIVVGDSIHNFADGLLIASAFLVSPEMGVLTTLSIALHELPQQTGDFLVLTNAGIERKRAFILMSIAGLAAIAGALIGYTILDNLNDILPYALILAAASFMYIAVADLIPQMQRRLKLREALSQLQWIALGVLIIWLVATQLHHH